MNPLAKIRNAGFDISLNGHNITITPFSRLTGIQLAYLKTHKAKIIQGLKQEQTANDSKAAGLTANNEKAIRTWLGHIGEFNPAIIHEVLDKCRTDLEALAYFLNRVKAMPTPQPDPDDDRHYCRECRNLINRRCVASPNRCRPVDDIPRRCADFSEAGQ